MCTVQSYKIFFSAISMVLAVATWSIVCYSFVENSLELISMLLWSSSSSNQSDENGYTIETISIIATALAFHVVRILCEGLMCALLVIQFLSSYDYALNYGEDADKSYEINWNKCHQSVLFWSTVIYTITLCTSFILAPSVIIVYEVSIMSVNLLFLLLISLIEFMLKSNNKSSSLSLEDSLQEEKDLERSRTYKLNIESFLVNEKKNEKPSH